MATDTNTQLYRRPAVIRPSVEDLAKISNELGFNVPPESLPQYKGVIDNYLESYDLLESLPEPTLPVNYPRTPGYRPHPSKNPLNAWEWRCDIKGAEKGKLSGLTVGIKNTIAVAGVPLTFGSKLLAGYVPEFDATVVRRILEHGGNILGMTSCEDLCFSGASFTNSHGPVLNPCDHTRMSGGSSSGSAVLVATGEVDIALGSDQAGSIRIPASWCGIVGLKPTFGLVPYTGICSGDPTIDHVGPMARTVRECALMLEAIAGYDDGLDARQPCNLDVPQYTQLLTGDVNGLRIAIIEEGFANCEEDVARIVYEATERMQLAGAVVKKISFPEHAMMRVQATICLDGLYNTVFNNHGAGGGFKGFYPTSLMDTFATRIAAEPHNFSEDVKLALMLSHHVHKNYHNRFYGKAQNVVREIKKKFDKLFVEYDVLVMPTLIYKAPKLPTADSTLAERLKIMDSMVQNTGVFNATGHPAISVSAGKSDGLPVGMMIVGGDFCDARILDVAFGWEKIRDGHN